MASDAYSSLQIPDFRRFLSTRIATTLSTQIISVAVGYFVYDLTSSKLMLGLLGLTTALPAIGVSLWAGHLADKRDRRNMLLFCIGVYIISSTTLFSLVLMRDQLSQSALLTGIYGALFVQGIGRGFLSPTHTAFLPQLVDKSLLRNAVSWGSSSWEVASITGLGLGGVMYGWLGPTATFGISVMLSVLGFLTMSAIRSRPLPQFDRTESAISRIREGLRFVFSRQIIIASIAMDLFAVLFGGAVALLPVFAKDILKVGPEGFGALRMAMSLGAITMAFFLAHKPLGRGAGRLMMAAVAGFGLCIIGFGLSNSFWLSFGLLVAAGMFDEVSVFVRHSLIQLYTPDEMKGRVASVSSVFIITSNEIGEFESGLTAEWFGTRRATVIGGLLTLAVVAVAAWKAPKLREMEFENEGMRE